MNVVKTSFSTQLSLTVPSSRPGVEIEPAKLVIKPTATDSVIELKFSMFCDGGHFNCGFRITRNINGTDVLVTPASNNWEGFISAIHGDEANHDSVPTSITTLWYDEPNTTSEVTYKLWIGRSTTSGTQTFTVNRNTGGTGSALYETGVSTAIAIEYPKTARPLDTENALTIPPFVGATNKEKLYNQSGDLYFNGKQLSNEWFKNGGDLYRLGANVGIGKSSPAYKLDVTGDINFTSSLRKNGSALGEWNASGSNVYRSSGRVGIGDTSPDAKLEVSGDLNLAATNDNWNSSVGKGLYMRFYGGSVNKAYIQSIDRSNSDTQYPLLFYCSEYTFLTRGSGETSDTERFKIHSNGNIGIGTTSPGYPLHVYGSTTTNGGAVGYLNSSGANTTGSASSCLLYTSPSPRD